MKKKKKTIEQLQEIQNAIYQADTIIRFYPNKTVAELDFGIKGGKIQIGNLPNEMEKYKDDEHKGVSPYGFVRWTNSDLRNPYGDEAEVSISEIMYFNDIELKEVSENSNIVSDSDIDCDDISEEERIISDGGVYSAVSYFKRISQK